MLAQGKVAAIGTSNELKKKFGCGYWLNIELGDVVKGGKKVLA